MTLTLGNAPFSRSGGEFNFQLNAPGHILYLEDSPRRVRVAFAGQTIADSIHCKRLHETGYLPVYYFPEKDIRTDYFEASNHVTHCPFKGQATYHSVRVGEQTAESCVWTYRNPVPEAPALSGLYAFYFDAMDAWFEEDEQIFVHPRDPYHRVDVRNSSRRVRVRVHETLIAETQRPKIVFETGLPPRYYIPRADIDNATLVPSAKVTQCPYKGRATYWSVRVGEELVRDVAWSYLEPLPEAAKVAEHICFPQERVELETHRFC